MVYLPAVLKGARSEATSARVALMRLKLRAQGPDFVPQVAPPDHLSRLLLVRLLVPRRLVLVPRFLSWFPDVCPGSQISVLVAGFSPGSQASGPGSQTSQFFCVAAKTLEAWEQGTRLPQNTLCVQF